MPFTTDMLIDRLFILIPLWVSLSIHEFAHAWSAWRLGDDTARLSGRLTLNPMAHIDPIGTLLFPLLGIPFGWAKPVPVNPLRFTRRVSMRTGMMLTAVAGPIANLVLAAASMVVLVVLILCNLWVSPAGHTAILLAESMMAINVILAVFNMLPIPPLDGSRVADGLMPESLRPAWQNVCQLGPMALIAVILLPRFTGFNLFAWPLRIAGNIVVELLQLFGR